MGDDDVGQDGDDGSLALTDRQRELLAAMQEALRSGPRAPGGRTRGGRFPLPGQRDVSAALPSCPLGAPPKSISTQIDPRTGDLYLRCLHTTADPGPHCWDLTGRKRSDCA